jgi:hypothetical protein
MKAVATLGFLAIAATGVVPIQTQSGAGAGEAADPTPLFSSNDPLTVTIRVPFKELFKDKSDDAPAQEGTFTYLVDGEPVTVDLKVTLRGKTRRRKCRFPPLRLDFPKEKLGGTLLEGQNRLKLVVQCDPRKDDYHQYVILEYLVYRCLNAFTDMSFRVRPMHITYEDTNGEEEPISNFAFVIEDQDDVAARNGWVALRVPGVPPDYMDPFALTRIEVFQFMVGHTDWSAFAAAPGSSECCHNAKVIGDPAGPVYSIPYDFDYTGIVNARYAEVNDQLGIRNVRERIYRGMCSGMGELPAVLQEFNLKQFEIYDMFQNQEGLSEKQRERVTKYLDDFYKIINDPGQTRRYFERECRRVG